MHVPNRAFPMCLTILFVGGCAAPSADGTHEIRGDWVAVDGSVSGQRIPAASLPLLRVRFSDRDATWTFPGFPGHFEVSNPGEGHLDSLDFRFHTEAPLDWVMPVRARFRSDTLDLVFPLAEPFDPAEAPPPTRPADFQTGDPGPLVHLSLVRDSAPATSPAPATPAAAASLDAAAIARRVEVLVSPEMEGRGSGQPGGERAADTISTWFGEVGLEPLGDDGFRQDVPLRHWEGSGTLSADSAVFRSGADFAVSGLGMRTRPATEVRVSGEIVLFGPSLGPAASSAPRPTPDVAGKVVAWLALAGPADGSGADLMRTYEALQRSGAAAIIALLPGPAPEPMLASPLWTDVWALADDLYGTRPGAPILFLGVRAFESLFGDGAQIMAFAAGLASGGPVTLSTGRDVSIDLRLREVAVSPTHNVIGILRGSDPALRDEAVVFTAHYDAFGLQDGAIFPGAADNALGVAELVEIAAAIRRTDTQPRRSLIFLATGAEERGMLGTLHWMRNPTWPLARVVANINLDGGDAEAWGPLHGAIDLTRHATLGGAAAEAAAAMGFPLLPNDGPADGSSDFRDFLSHGIPAIQLMGIGGEPDSAVARDRRFTEQRVHQPGDRLDPQWDWTGPRDMAALYLRLGLDVANRDARPEFRAASPYAR